MIKYQLRCSFGHEFEGWFKSSQAFDEQAAVETIACPNCGNRAIAKSIMAPNVAISRKDDHQRFAFEPANVTGREPSLRHAIRKFREHLAENAEYIGTRFPEEVRRMHDNDEPLRHVWGEATAEEARDLLDDGIPVLPVPALPEELD